MGTRARGGDGGLLAGLVPAGVVARELVADLRVQGDDSGLSPEEAAVVAAAVPRRRRQFAAGRRLAREALVDLGRAPVPILPGERGAPTWPVGVVGSVTHCDGYVAAALGEASRWRALGIDAEPAAPLPPHVLGRIASATERTWLAERSAERPEVAWDRLLFCIKEAVFKTWFPVHGTSPGFRGAEVRLDDGDGFVATVEDGSTASGVRAEVPGRWVQARGLLVCASWS
ncbi:MAG: 4'-phosphopantetheinyl transferase superfamily protein [Aeromicrobium erythreum]